MKVLIVGLGSIAIKHINALFSINKNTKIYALRSNSNKNNVEGVTNIYDLKTSKIIFDFAIISNPTHLHFKFIEKLTTLEIPLFIEKPVLHSLDKINYLTSIIERKSIVTYVACNLRFHPCILFLKRRIEEKKLKVNEVNVYCGSYLPDWRPNQDFRTVYSANADTGGGVHLDLFHELDYTTWLFGLPTKSNSLVRSSSTLNITAFDYANYTLEYNTFTASIILNYYRKQPKREIEIVLENNIWTVDLINNNIINNTGEYLFKDEKFEVKDTYRLQLLYFTNCLTKKKTPMNSFKESLENLKICLQHE